MYAAPRSLTSFDFETNTVRVVKSGEELWFVASDVAKAIGHADASRITRLLNIKEKGLHRTATAGGDQIMVIISEGGLYRVLATRRVSEEMRGTPLEARIKRFQDWIFHKVLPEIRKNGSYGQPPATIDVRDPRQLLEIARQLVEVNRELEQKVEEGRPKVEFHNRFVESDGLYGLQEAGRIIGHCPNKFVTWLRRDAYVYSRGGVVAPYIQYLHMGLFAMKVTMVDGRARQRTWITPKGLAYFAERYPRSPDATLPLPAPRNGPIAPAAGDAKELPLPPPVIMDAAVLV